MDWITINGKDIHFFMVMTNGFTNKRTSTSNMSIRKDNTLFCIHNESRGFRSLGTYSKVNIYAEIVVVVVVPSVSKAATWLNRIDTMALTTCSMVDCHLVGLRSSALSSSSIVSRSVVSLTVLLVPFTTFRRLAGWQGVAAGESAPSKSRSLGKTGTASRAGFMVRKKYKGKRKNGCVWNNSYHQPFWYISVTTPLSDMFDSNDSFFMSRYVVVLCHHERKVYRYRFLMVVLQVVYVDPTISCYSSYIWFSPPEG